MHKVNSLRGHTTSGFTLRNSDVMTKFSIFDLKMGNPHILDLVS